MKNTSTLNKKLKSYSAIAGTVVAAANSADAQIVYTNVTPDTVVNTGGSYDLDLDNDGTIDFQFAVQHGTYMYGTIPLMYDLAVVVPGTGNAIDTVAGGQPPAHNLNDPIGSSLTWVDDVGASYQLLGLTLPAVAYQAGNFVGVNDKYVGLRFKIGAADHYGWVRIDLNSAVTALTIKDYAYDGTAGTMIPAGSIATGIDESSALLAHAVTVISSDKTIRVNMNSAKAEGIVTVTNTLGQEVANAKVTGSQVVIPMDNASTGIYMVTVSQESGRFTQKVIVK